MLSTSITGDETVGGEIDNAALGERRALERGFAGVLAAVNIGSRDAEVFGDCVELVGGVGFHAGLRWSPLRGHGLGRGNFRTR